MIGNGPHIIVSIKENLLILYQKYILRKNIYLSYESVNKFIVDIMKYYNVHLNNAFVLDNIINDFIEIQEDCLKDNELNIINRYKMKEFIMSEIYRNSLSSQMRDYCIKINNTLFNNISSDEFITEIEIKKLIKGI